MPAAADPFPAAALAALDLPAVLEWIAAGARTPAGRREVLASGPGLDRAERTARRARGQEAEVLLAGAAAPALERCVDLTQAGEEARRRTPAGEELAALARSLGRLAELRGWIAARPEAPALAAVLAAAPDLEPLRLELERCLDPRGEVRDEADPALAELRRDLADLERRRRTELDRVAERWRERGLLQNPRPVERHGRPVLAVRAGQQGRARGLVHDRSRSGDTLFVEPEEVLALANRIDAGRARERQLVHRVLARLGAEVAARREDLAAADRCLGRFDAAFAAAAWAAEVGGRWPEESPRQLLLRGARHPLLIRSLGREEVVPLDLELGGDFDLLVVTGPNTGGKTVVLKTVGLLAALAGAGLPVSAEEGTALPVLPGIDADVGDPQSLENSLSTFSGHLARILRALRHGPPGGLVLLDELGTGTDPEEGAALGRAVLEALLARGSLVLANTHLGSLKLFSVQQERAENASMEFDPVSLAPSFRLLVGVPGASHALEVAERLGLPDPILQAARAYSRGGGGAEALLAEVAGVRRQAERIRERARDAEAEARERLREAEAEEEAARSRAELRLREAEMAFRDLRSDLERELEEAGRRLRDRLPGAAREAFDTLLARIRRLLDASEPGRRWDAFLAGLRKGEVVWVPRYRERLRVLRVDKNRRRLKLRRGELEIEVPFHEISWVEPPPGTDPPER
ncbi:MAG: hypothetical protein D6702_05530 [Planctomycetota bacterium]|nr:MAG: hypothetical protein D6702_05530 [Planctomycetota bacterium]